jgi:TolA-binding protein
MPKFSVVVPVFNEEDSIEILFEEIKRLKEDNLQLAKLMSERPHSAAAPSATSKKKGAMNSAGGFDASIGAFKAKDFPGAIAGFRSFLEVNPKSKHALDARFFLGESLFKTKEYAEAIVEFGVIHEKAQNSALGRRATLRIAQSFKSMGKEKDARAFAQILIQSNPNSDEARKARAVLK